MISRSLVGKDAYFLDKNWSCIYRSCIERLSTHVLDHGRTFHVPNLIQTK